MLRPSFIFSVLLIASAHTYGADQWFKGNTHTHSLWSDGNDFPEMITRWYKERGYNFLGLSDHNTLHTGDKWMTEAAILKRKKALGKSPIEKYVAAFDESWVERRTNDKGEPEIRLRRLDEYGPKFEEAGKFLLVQTEEISAKFKNAPIHMNAINIGEVIQPLSGDSYAEVMRANLKAVEEQSKRLGRPMIVHINHPNFQWALTAEVLAEVVEDRFLEVYNGHPMIHWEGDELHASNELLWDIACTLRIAKLNAPPPYGMATDDSHHYHGEESSPGRGWIMVKAPSLTADALVESMKKGDFYASSGVTIESISFVDGKLRIQIKPQEGVTYTTRINGTLENYDTSTSEVAIPKEAKDPHPTRIVYSKDVGKTLATFEGTSVEWTPSGKELYFRATIVSNKAHPNPSFPGQTEMAWLQPMVWKK